MRRRAVIFAFLAGFLPCAATIAAPCDQELADEAGILDPVGLAKVQEVVAKLTDAGARVRVRVMELPAEGTLEGYQSAQERNCVSWRGVQGRRLNTLVSLLYQTKGGPRGKGAIGIFFGSYWEEELEPLWMPILLKDMKPLLDERQYATALSIGINKLAIAAKAKATTVSSGKPVTVINEVATDYTVLWIAIKYFILGLLALSGLYGIYSLFVSIGRARALRRAKRQEAQTNRSKCGSFIVAIESRMTALRNALGSLASMASEHVLVEFRTAVEAAASATSAPMEDYRSSDETGSANPDREGLSAAEYAAMAERYGLAYSQLEAAAKKIDTAEKIMQRLIKLANIDLPAALKAATAAIKEADLAVQAASDAGFRTRLLREALTRAVDLNGLAKELAAQLEIERAKAAADEAARISNAAKNEAVSLPKKKETLVAAAETEAERASGMHERVAQGTKAMAVIKADFADSCWELVDGNAEEAGKRLAGAERELGLYAPDLEHGDLAEAEKHVGQARAWLDQADSYLNSIVALETNLRAAKSAAQGDLSGAQSDIAAARSFLDAHGDTVVGVPDCMEKLVAADRLLEVARGELAKDRPDFIFAVKQIGKASAAARAVLKGAQEDEAAHVRKVRQLASLKRDANSAVSAAREYIQDHRSDVDADAQRNLAKAQAGLKEIDAAKGLDAQIEKAEAAMKLARKAIKQAKEDVEDRARKRREREAARAQARLRSTYDTGHFHTATSVSIFSTTDSTPSFSGGGFSDFGGGGGSISLGGGGGDGGGGSIGL